MGNLFSPPRPAPPPPPPPPPPPVVPVAPAPKPVELVKPSKPEDRPQKSVEKAKPEEKNATKEARKAMTEAQKHSRLGTVKTSWRGILNPRKSDDGRKSLLGE